MAINETISFQLGTQNFASLAEMTFLHNPGASCDGVQKGKFDVHPNYINSLAFSNIFVINSVLALVYSCLSSYSLSANFFFNSP